MSSDAPLDAQIDGFLVKFERWRKSQGVGNKKRRVVRVRVLAYWPASQWEAMAERWPQFVAEYGGDHETHRRSVEDMLRAHAEAADVTLAVAQLTADGLVEFARAKELDEAASETRAAYAHELGSERLAVQWPPPGRLKCWCGSGLKYRDCCGAPKKRV